MSMENHTYEYFDYDINKCIGVINRWMQAMVVKMSMGDVFVNSIHVEKKSTGDVSYPYKWSLKINYSENERE